MKGFTLIEMMVSLTVFGLLMSIGVPKLGQLYDAHQSRTSVLQFKRALHTTRLYALQNRANFTVCVLKNAECSRYWDGPLTIFQDSNTNAIKEENELAVVTIADFGAHGKWSKKQAERAFVRYDESGHAFSSATTFLFCPDSGEIQNARQVVINFQGRTRVANYLSSRGRPYASVHPLTCR